MAAVTDYFFPHLGAVEPLINEHKYRVLNTILSSTVGPTPPHPLIKEAQKQIITPEKYRRFTFWLVLGSHLGLEGLTPVEADVTRHVRLSSPSGSLRRQ